MKKAFLFSFFFLIGSNVLFSQVTEQTLKYRNDPYGNKSFRKKGVMDGNQIRTLFRNDGQIGSWPDRPSGEWPKGTGHHYLDGCTPIVSTRLETPAGVVHPAESSYREEVDVDPATGQLWVMEPVPGYSNPGAEIPAISTDPRTWPEMWPRTLPLITPEWDGYWFGYFGRGVQNADFETFYVMDDSQDKEYNRPPYSYYPVLSDSARGGVGVREEVRGFQWSHVLAEDIIFWHFDIINISDFDHDSTIFGFYADTGVGGVDDNGDDNANYNTLLDLTYSFDADGWAPPDRWKTGYVGYAYLESPGNALNGYDDDEDGLVDERRDDGIDNDGDWAPFLDINGNGKWDATENEPLNNDVGEDGVGPFDLQYNGPDKGEGDGIPTNGEPNFDKTDKDESDQIGLTSLKIDRLDNKGPLSIWPKNDEYIWSNLLQGNFDTTVQKANIQIAFGSGPFPLKLNKQERFSVALVFGSNFDDMVFNKETVQQIYNANYNFTRPPLKASLSAVAGDKKVFLYWNSISEQSRDPFLGFEQDDPTLGYKKDFEGYLIYRSEEPEFNDIKVITDSKGEPKYWKPIAQYDLSDEISGPDPIGINGAHFWRGDNTGLQHSYIDENVVNGRTYYYACVAYDMGDPEFGTAGLLPTETTKIITQDLVGNILFVDINCAVVTPNSPAAGYIAPSVTFNPPATPEGVTQLTEGLGTGSIDVAVLDGSLVNDGATYKVIFQSTGNIPKYTTSSYSVAREFNGVVDTLDVNGSASNIGAGKYSSPFDGIAVSMSNYDSAVVNLDKTGWIKGFSTLYMPVTPDRSNAQRDVAWPSDYELEWLADYSKITPFTKIPLNFKVTNLSRGDTVQAEIIDNDKSKTFTLGDEIVIIEYEGTTYKLTWNIGYFPPISIPYIVHPSPGDRFLVSINKPYYTGDYFTFSTSGAKVENSTAQSSLDKIGVVPNPYISANAWEERNLNQTGRGERRIDFINLPAQCEIRIYTLNGALVKTLYKDTSPTNGAISWNLVSEDGMDIAYGLYIFHVTAPNIGEKIGKFAVIK
jgi:hypothetical protein